MWWWRWCETGVRNKTAAQLSESGWLGAKKEVATCWLDGSREQPTCHTALLLLTTLARHKVLLCLCTKFKTGLNSHTCTAELPVLSLTCCLLFNSDKKKLKGTMITEESQPLLQSPSQGSKATLRQVFCFWLPSFTLWHKL